MGPGRKWHLSEAVAVSSGRKQEGSIDRNVEPARIVGGTKGFHHRQESAAAVEIHKCADLDVAGYEGHHPGRGASAPKAREILRACSSCRRDFADGVAA